MDTAHRKRLPQIHKHLVMQTFFCKFRAVTFRRKVAKAHKAIKETRDTDMPHLS